MLDQLPNPSEFSAFVEALEIEGVDLLKINAFRQDRVPNNAKGQVSVNATPSLEKLESKTLCALIDVKVEGKAKSGEQIFECLLTLRVSYKIISPRTGITDRRDLGDFFTKTNVVINVWPYVREQIASITTRFGIGTVTLGLLKTNRRLDQDESSKNGESVQS